MSSVLDELEDLVPLLPPIAAVKAASGPELDAVLVELDYINRMVESRIAAALEASVHTGHHHADGHRTVGSWLQATTNCSGAERKQRVRIAKALPHLEDIASRLASGRLSVASVNETARVFSNPRVRDALIECQDDFIRAASEMEYADFEQFSRRWESLADADGAHRRERDIHDARNASISRVGNEFVLSGKCGTVQGTIIQNIWQQFNDAEYATDLQTAHADDALGPLPRTAAQRRIDALEAALKVAAAAVNSGTSGQMAEPLVNIVIDETTFNEQLDHMMGGPKPQPDHHNARSRRCETSDGHWIDPQHAITAALLGHIRRVIISSDSIIVDAGRRTRLYRGPIRDAIKALHPRCIWLGCELRAAISQIDHATPYSRHGSTDAANAAPVCAHHNAFKSNTHTATHNPNGTWHITRPNGTTIQPPDTDSSTKPD